MIFGSNIQSLEERCFLGTSILSWDTNMQRSSCIRTIWSLIFNNLTRTSTRSLQVKTKLTFDGLTSHGVILCLQGLNILTNITKGTLEIINDVHIIIGIV